MPTQTSYNQFQPAGYPGMHADMREWDGSTKTATATIAFGAPVQRSGENGCAPLTNGEYLGLAKAMHTVTGNGDSYVAGDNVPVVDEGAWYGRADAAIAAGAQLRWNTVAGRWTAAAASGTVIEVPQAEAESAASGADAIFKVRLRRIPS
jgi:hypothetical protein